MGIIYGECSNILRHPIFYAIPVVLIAMVVMLFKSGLAHGDVFGSKKHQASVTAGFQKSAEKAVDLNKDKNGYYSGGKWVSLPARITDKGTVPIEPGKGTPGTGASPGASKRAAAIEAYHPPATVAVVVCECACLYLWDALYCVCEPETERRVIVYAVVYIVWCNSGVIVQTKLRKKGEQGRKT
jgi:hypothetical protein